MRETPGISETLLRGRSHPHLLDLQGVSGSQSSCCGSHRGSCSGLQGRILQFLVTGKGLKLQFCMEWEIHCQLLVLQVILSFVSRVDLIKLI